MSHRSAVVSPRRRRSSADLCCLLACVLSACTLGGGGHELILEAAGTAGEGAAGAPSTPPPAAATSVRDPALAGASSAVGASGASAAIGGGAGGSAGTKAGAPTGTPPAGSHMADDAGIEPGTDETTCGFNFAVCVTLNPLGFVDCATQAAPNCAEILFGGDAGGAPSAACSMQEATCLKNNPNQVDLCMAMLASCTL